jgi:transcriptional regulator with XRE-family HTH domain
MHIIINIMPRPAPTLLPVLQRTLHRLGERIRLARLRRRFSAAVVAERAGISRITLSAIERGDPRVAFGSYVNVLFSLDLHRDLEQVGADDVLGRKLQDAGLLTKKRAPRQSQ